MNDQPEIRVSGDAGSTSDAGTNKGENEQTVKRTTGGPNEGEVTGPDGTAVADLSEQNSGGGEQEDGEDTRNSL